jgi:hypothetical protein
VVCPLLVTVEWAIGRFPYRSLSALPSVLLIVSA